MNNIITIFTTILVIVTAMMLISLPPETFADSGISNIFHILYDKQTNTGSISYDVGNHTICQVYDEITSDVPIIMDHFFTEPGKQPKGIDCAGTIYTNYDNIIADNPDTIIIYHAMQFSIVDSQGDLKKTNIYSSIKYKELSETLYPQDDNTATNSNDKHRKSSYNPPPTLGVNNNNKRMVDNGFGCNDNIVNVDYYYTEYPIINTLIGEKITCQLIIYENRGINNIKWIQFFVGVPEVGSPLSRSETIVQIILSSTELEEINITDKQNLIQDFNVILMEPAKCKESFNNLSCLKVIFEYKYRETPLSSIVAVSLMDTQRSSWSFFFNDGIISTGESLNEPPTDSFMHKTSSQLPIVQHILKRTDKINNIWADQFGIEYQKNTQGTYKKITPMPKWECNDKPLHEVKNPTRINCHFSDYKKQQAELALEKMLDICSSCVLLPYDGFENSWTYEFPER